MNPYETDPEKIPSQDRYADVPNYGRYFPQSDDFHPDSQYVLADSAESLQYWADVLDLCTSNTRIYEDPDGRDVFALGRVIVKSCHLHDTAEGWGSARDFVLADANEVEAAALARNALKEVKVPDIYFSGKVHPTGRSVLVQERIPGIGLNVAWQYISQSQKEDFKQQAREVLRQLSKITAGDGRTNRSYVVQSDPIIDRGLQTLEKDILFGPKEDEDICFMHNDFSLSNCIVNNDKIVALIDWEMAGYFGWKTAGDVHVQIRTPKRENFAKLDLPEDLLRDITFWNDLYDV
ncbi:hypothetical protein G7046_g5650 [Stylonectria norvegica]|nr:hypothetical protein G7046_g5650 [Stylonectria norvegica]